jgi:hypothetical protein
MSNTHGIVIQLLLTDGDMRFLSYSKECMRLKIRESSEICLKHEHRVASFIGEVRLYSIERMPFSCIIIFEVTIGVKMLVFLSSFYIRCYILQLPSFITDTH